MQYLQYIQRVIKPYNVGLVGWTHKTFVTLSCLSEGEAGIQKLFDAVIDDTCKFVKFSSDKKWEAHIKEHEATIASGKMVLIPAKVKAKGKKKAMRNEVINEEDMDTT